MKKSKKLSKARVMPDSPLRRLRNTPSYFFLIWRWGMWLYALIAILGIQPPYTNTPAFPYKDLAYLLLTITFIQTLVVTLYAPIFQILLPGRLRLDTFLPLKSHKLWRSRRLKPIAEDEDVDIMTPLARTRNIYWDVTIYGLDVLICGLAMYFGGALSNPPFGSGSPFYRYGISTAYAAAFAYRYRGGLAAALGYDLFAVLGMVLPAPGTMQHTSNIIDIAGSLIDTPLAAILAAYLASLLGNYAQSKRREQDNARTQKALVRVGETLMTGGNNQQQLLQKSALQIRQGGHFHRLIIGLTSNITDEEESKPAQPVLTTCIEAALSDEILPRMNNVLIEQVVHSGQKFAAFEPLSKHKGYGIARIILPFFKEGQIQMALGAESLRQTPFGQKQEEFLTIAGAQLLVALDNIRLTEQTIQLVAAAERGRIARDIHDGIAQLTYMLSLNAETCAAQAHRIVEASEEDAELLTPLATRLDKLVAVSKQALWETRNYMFSLKPLISGTTTLTEMLTNQVHEFQTISDLPVQLEVSGSEELPNGDRQRARRYAQIGTAIFRIVQEALTNAFKHAEATQLWVYLKYEPNGIEVEITDNGRGLNDNNDILTSSGKLPGIYSGHGMHGMRERAVELGGTLDITHIPTGGVKVRAQIPF